MATCSFQGRRDRGRGSRPSRPVLVGGDPQTFPSHWAGRQTAWTGKPGYEDGRAHISRIHDAPTDLISTGVCLMFGLTGARGKGPRGEPRIIKGSQEVSRRSRPSRRVGASSAGRRARAAHRPPGVRRDRAGRGSRWSRARGRRQIRVRSDSVPHAQSHGGSRGEPGGAWWSP